MSFGAVLGALGGAAGSLVNAFQNQQHHEDWLNWEKYKLQYNSIPNQVAQWKAAGLNPNSFSGSFQPASGTPPQPFSVGNGIASAIQNAGQLYQQKEIAKMSNKVQMKNLELQNKYYDIANADANMRKEMHNWSIKRAQQAYEQGNIEMAKSFLDFSYLLQTHSDRIGISHNQKSLSDNELKQSNEFVRRYPEYLATKIEHEIEQSKSLRHQRDISDKHLVLDWNKHYQDDAHYWNTDYRTNYNKSEDRKLRKYGIDLNDRYRSNQQEFREYMFDENLRRKGFTEWTRNAKSFGKHFTKFGFRY